MSRPKTTLIQPGRGGGGGRLEGGLSFLEVQLISELPPHPHPAPAGSPALPAPIPLLTQQPPTSPCSQDGLKRLSPLNSRLLI